MKVTSPSGKEYVIGAALGETESFNLARASGEFGTNGIAKIAVDAGHNGPLDREAFILDTLRTKAAEIEITEARLKPGRKGLGYRHYFPNLVESFVSPELEGRRINILSFSAVKEDLSELVPISHFLSRERVRVDPKTSVWMLGRLLKLLDFAHTVGVTVRLDGDNILVHRHHFITIFDWSESKVTLGKQVSSEVACEAISRAAYETILALGGNIEEGTIPPDDQLEDDGYQELLFNLANGAESNAREAHQKFYSFVRSVWPGKFHPFTAYPVIATITAENEEETE
mgnify:CR=1 FL=1